MEKTFDEQIRVLQEERQNNEYWENIRRKARGEHTYSWYCVWCNAYNDGNGKTDSETFDRYCEEQGVEVDFWKRKMIGEIHLGEHYVWNGNGWEITK